jgi:hypothetical protein
MSDMSNDKDVKSKRVMPFADAVEAWERVASRPVEMDDEIDGTANDGEPVSVGLCDPMNPMVHFYLDNPTDRSAVMLAKIMEDQGDAMLVFYPLNTRGFKINPVDITENSAGIFVDTLNRDEDSVFRMMTKDDAIWAIGRTVETMRELLDGLKDADNG